MAHDTRKYIDKIMCIILARFINSLFCLLTLIFLAFRPNFVEDIFCGLVFVHYQDPRH